MVDVHATSCDENIFRDGHHLATLGENTRELLNELCNRINKDTDVVRTDWHFVGGRGCILYLGPYETAKSLLLKHLDWYNTELTSVMRKNYPDVYKFYGDEYKIQYGESCISPPDHVNIGQVMNN